MKIGYTEAIHYTQKGKQIEVVNNLYRTLFLILGVIILSLPQALSNESEFLQFWDGITSGNAAVLIIIRLFLCLFIIIFTRRLDLPTVKIIESSTNI